MESQNLGTQLDGLRRDVTGGVSHARHLKDVLLMTKNIIRRENVGGPASVGVGLVDRRPVEIFGEDSSLCSMQRVRATRLIAISIVTPRNSRSVLDRRNKRTSGRSRDDDGHPCRTWLIARSRSTVGENPRVHSDDREAGRGDIDCHQVARSGIDHYDQRGSWLQRAKDKFPEVDTWTSAVPFVTFEDAPRWIGEGTIECRGGKSLEDSRGVAGNQTNAIIRCNDRVSAQRRVRLVP